MFSLPVTPISTGTVILSTVYKVGANFYTGFSYIDISRSVPNIIPFTNGSPSIPVNATTPGNWGTDDTIRITGSYEIT